MTTKTYDGRALAREYLTNVATRGVTPGYRNGGAAALRYLRALEAVARAARMIEACERECWIDTARAVKATIAIAATVARLRRVSGGVSRRGSTVEGSGTFPANSRGARKGRR